MDKSSVFSRDLRREILNLVEPYTMTEKICRTITTIITANETGRTCFTQSNNVIKQDLKLITLEFLFLKQSNRNYNAE